MLRCEKARERGSMIGAASEGARVREGGTGSEAAGKRAAAREAASITRISKICAAAGGVKTRETTSGGEADLSKINNCNVNNEMKCKV